MTHPLDEVPSRGLHVFQNTHLSVQGFRVLGEICGSQSDIPIQEALDANEGDLAGLTSYEEVDRLIDDAQDIWDNLCLESGYLYRMGSEDEWEEVSSEEHYSPDQVLKATVVAVALIQAGLPDLEDLQLSMSLDGPGEWDFYCGELEHYAEFLQETDLDKWIEDYKAQS